MVAGRYRLLETIGSGAMGVVWRARDERLERVIAVKQLIIRPGLTPAKTEEARRRAMREARIAARLHHRNAIALLDVAEHAGDPCLIMEFLQSRSLSAVLNERGTLPPEQVAAIGSQVAAALAAAHAAGIVHRDVKPGNILLDESGTVKITDFGISRAVDDNTITTETGLLAGTPAYLAPELARGQDPSAKSDVFSLGSTLYHALEGKPPFGLNPNPLALLHAVASGEVAPPRNAGALTGALMTLLTTEPGDRPTMAEAVSLLAAPTAPMAVPAQSAADPRTVPTRTPVKVNRPAVPPPPPPPPARAEGGYEDPPTSVEEYAAPPKRGAALVGAMVVVAALAAAVVIVLSTKEGGNSALPTPTTDTVTSIVTVSGEPKPDDNTAASPPPAAASPVTNYTAAGEAVIRYFNTSNSAEERWNLLTEKGKSFFGGMEQFNEFWSQYRYVAPKGANGITINGDGSANVPVTVERYGKDGNLVQSARPGITVVNVSGKHYIDSDTR